MSAETWLDDNSRYLAASLHWLRLKLCLLAGDAPKPSPVVRRRAWFGSGSQAADTCADAVPRQRDGARTDPADVAGAEAQRTAAAHTDPAPALLLLAQRLGLSVFERDTLLLCAAVELDPDVAALIAAVPGAGAQGHPSFALALRLFDEPSWDALSPHRPLRRARLLDVNQPGATALTAAALRADERIVHFIKGLNEIDERLANLLVATADAPPPLLSASQQAKMEDLLHQWRALAEPARAPLVILLGADGASKLETARAACAEVGHELYRLALDSLPATRAEAEQLARLWQRECRLLPLALYVEADELDRAGGEGAGLLRSFLARDLGLAFVSLREPGAMPTTGTLTIEIDKPSAAEQHDAWLDALQALAAPADAERGAASLAGQFHLNLRDIGHALALAGDGPGGPVDRAWQACRQATMPRLDMLAQRIDARATWSDLVLGDEALQLLHQIAAQVRQRYRVYQDWGYAKKMNRGLGLSALFAGESGTGKTMAAEVLANELDLALYRIDLSAVVSKYIGETEKNLRRLFDAAETGGAILLFDEADALFGKRSEVKDSHDRYANIEINYLLQRMESFSGLAILATNMKSALDTAFLRRLRFVVHFAFPGVAERRRLWHDAVLPGVPQEALEVERLARFSLSGGNVTGIALNAAFAAAERDGRLTMPLMLAALRNELRKLDRPISEAEFR